MRIPARPGPPRVQVFVTVTPLRTATESFLGTAAR